MINLLLIEDNAGDAYLVNELLNHNKPHEYKVTHVSRIQEAIDQVTKDKYDLIISDIALPDSQGTDSFKSLRNVASNLPVIFFTGTHDESLAVTAIRRGAQDYLLKGNLNEDMLKRSIRYAIERKQFQLEAEVEKTRARKLRMERNILKKESEQLIKLNQAKDDFVSLASHQLRTPATAVKQYVEMVLDGYAGDIPDKARQYLYFAKLGNERQLKIINDLLKTAHLDAGKITLTYTTFDILELLSEIIAEQQNTFKKRHQSIDYSFPKSGSLNISADKENLRISLENIIENASKYSNQDTSICITVTKSKRDIVVTVKDSGVGIAKADLGKVFDKFARVTNPLSDDVGGSGLGLYWSKKIIEMHAGSITLTSKIGEGSVFTISIPRQHE